MTDLFAPLAKPQPAPPVAPMRVHRLGLHLCELCDRWGAFGFGVSIRNKRIGRWSCFDHREQVRAMK